MDTARKIFVAKVTEFLNSDARYLPGHTLAQTNEITAALIESGEIIAIPGDPYTYKVA